MKIFGLLTLAAFLCTAKCSKILLVFSMPSHSHFSLGFRLSKELADRGHQVTVINPYPQKTPIKNYRDISVEENIVFVEELKKTLFGLEKQGPIANMQLVFAMGNDLTDMTLGNPRVQKLLNSGETFDVVIIEHFLCDAFVAISHQLKAPTVFLAPMASSVLNNYLFSNPAPSSYVPNSMGSFTKHMTFFERLTNLLLNTVGDVMRELVFLSTQRSIFRKYTKDQSVDLDDVLYNSSLILTNSHISVNDAVPHVPSVIEIGGFHIQPPKKLPEDLQKFLDDAKEGVVLFSMGSNLKSKDLKPEVRDGILKSFSKIKQKVLWKFETDLPNAPKNVKIMKWLPQQDILAHPNVRVFISHGGLLSTIETVYFGVPVIGVPVFADQKSNIASAAANGYAISVPLPELTEETLSRALDEILNNPKYAENVKRRSSVMKDQPLKPIDSAVFWIEHVIRHRGAPHLKSAGLDLKWYQRDMLDIILFLTLITIALFVIFYIIIKKIIRRCFGAKKGTVGKGKKTN